MSITRNSATNLIGFIIPLFVTLVTVPVYLRIIGDERFGILAIIWVILGYFGFFDLGLGRATARRMAKLKNEPAAKRAELFWTSLLLTLVLGIAGGFVLWFFAGQFLSIIGDAKTASNHEAMSSIIWLIPALPLVLAISVMNGTLQGRESFIYLNGVNICTNVLIQTLPLLAAWFGYVELTWLVPAALSARLLTGTALFFICKNVVPFSTPVHFNIDLVRPLLTYGGKMSSISIIGQLLAISDRLLIGAILGAKSVTYYTGHITTDVIRGSGYRGIKACMPE